MELQEIIKNSSYLQMRIDWGAPINLIDFMRKYEIESYDDVLELRKLFALGLRYMRLKENENLDVKRFIELFEDGQTYNAITKDLGLTFEHCKMIRIELGLEKRLGGKPGWGRTEQDWNNIKKEIASCFSQGLSIADTAKKIGCADMTLRKWCGKFGISLPKRNAGPGSGKIKLLEILEKRYGAINSLELKEEYDVHLESGISKGMYHMIEERIERYGLEFLHLDLNVNELQGLNPKQIFGEYLGKYIIFMPGMEVAAVYELFKILRKNEWYKEYFGIRKYYAMNVERKSESYKQQSEEFVLNLVNSMKGMTILKEHIEILSLLLAETIGNRVAAVIDKNGVMIEPVSIEPPTKEELDIVLKPIRQNIKETFDKISDDDIEYQKQKSESVKRLFDLINKKIFGRRFNSKQYWEEFQESTIENKILKLREIFSAIGFVIVDSTQCDFILKGEKEFTVKIVDGDFSSMEEMIFSDEFENGILITLGSFEEEIEKIRDGKITIEIDGIREIIEKISYLPVRENSVGKIMYGEHVSELVVVDSVDLQTNMCSVRNIFTKEVFDVERNVLKEHIDSDLILKNADEFISIITYLKDLTEEDFLEIVENDNPVVITSQGSISQIKGNVDGRVVKINAYKEMYETRDLNVECVFSEMVNCSGIHWGEISEKQLICKHIGLVFYHLWKNQHEEFDGQAKTAEQDMWEKSDDYTTRVGSKQKYVTKSLVLKFIRELYFRLKIIPNLEVSDVENALSAEEKGRLDELQK